METPPIPSQAPLPVGRRGAVGKLGLFFSITALLTMLSLVLGKPS